MCACVCVYRHLHVHLHSVSCMLTPFPPSLQRVRNDSELTTRLTAEKLMVKI